jgi:hypothetical protein
MLFRGIFVLAAMCREAPTVCKQIHTVEEDFRPAKGHIR